MNNELVSRNKILEWFDKVNNWAFRGHAASVMSIAALTTILIAQLEPEAGLPTIASATALVGVVPMLVKLFAKTEEAQAYHTARIYFPASSGLINAQTDQNATQRAQTNDLNNKGKSIQLEKELKAGKTAYFYNLSRLTEAEVIDYQRLVAVVRNNHSSRTALADYQQKMGPPMPAYNPEPERPWF